MARMKLLLDTNVVIDFLHERAVRDELYLQVVVWGNSISGSPRRR